MAWSLGRDRASTGEFGRKSRRSRSICCFYRAMPRSFSASATLSLSLVLEPVILSARAHPIHLMLISQRHTFSAWESRGSTSVCADNVALCSSSQRHAQDRVAQCRIVEYRSTAEVPRTRRRQASRGDSTSAPPRDSTPSPTVGSNGRPCHQYALRPSYPRASLLSAFLGRVFPAHVLCDQQLIPTR